MQKVYDLTFTHHAPQLNTLMNYVAEEKGEEGSYEICQCLVLPTSLARKSSRKAHTQPTRHITLFMPGVAAAAAWLTRRAAWPVSKPQCPIRPRPLPLSPVTATYFITSKFVFECKTMRGNTKRLGMSRLFTAPKYMCYEMFPQKRKQFNKIMENVKMLRGRLRRDEIRPKRWRRFPFACSTGGRLVSSVVQAQLCAVRRVGAQTGSIEWHVHVPSHVDGVDFLPSNSYNRHLLRI